jgi:hypothetical protein
VILLFIAVVETYAAVEAILRVGPHQFHSLLRGFLGFLSIEVYVVAKLSGVNVQGTLILNHLLYLIQRTYHSVVVGFHLVNVLYCNDLGFTKAVLKIIC